ELQHLGGKRWHLTARASDLYAERAMIRDGTVHVLDLLAQKKSATGDEIAGLVDGRVPDKNAKVTRSAEGVRKAVDRLNAQFGVAIVHKKALNRATYEYSLNATLTNDAALAGFGVETRRLEPA